MELEIGRSLRLQLNDNNKLSLIIKHYHCCISEIAREKNKSWFYVSPNMSYINAGSCRGL